MIIYMEIKTVSVRRERDEREKLVAIRAMEKTKAMEELEEAENKMMAPRAYVTICGAVLLFVGLFCQLIPFCHLLSELGLPVAFHGFCPLFVMTSAFMLTACVVLLILGVVWSCTRGWAALVLLVLGLLGECWLAYPPPPNCACLAPLTVVVYLVELIRRLPAWFAHEKDRLECRIQRRIHLPSLRLVPCWVTAGDLMLFGGFVSCLIWTVLTVAIIYVYFVFLPSQYTDKGEPLPSWLQDIGSFEVEADVGKVGAGEFGCFTGH